MPSVSSVAVAVAMLLGLAVPATAQSLSPFEKTGVTPSDRKAFRLIVGNPYKRRMTFTVVPMQPDYETPATGATVKPAQLTIAPGVARQIIFTFDIDPAKKERTIALCVMPKALDGPILPRVCGLYTGRMAGRGS
jgi:hypothetical protein